ncbi:MAG: HAD family hydrolase [Phycisphaerales bacterium]
MARTTLPVLLALLCVSAIARAQDALPSWNDGASKQAIVTLVERVTTEGSADYVEPGDRIATFDNDGCLWAEQPVYFQLLFAVDRIRAMAPDNPGWMTTEPYKSVLAGDMESLAKQGHKAIGEIIARTHAGMSTEQFDDTVREWLETARHPTTGRRYTDMVYKPMLELLEYLRKNGFQTFIVSGGGIDFLRVFAEEVYGIPSHQVVGSGMKTGYEVRNGVPTLVKLAELNFIDDKEGKPVGIHQHIGRRPFFAAGNSDGDFQMLEYVTAGDGPRFGLLVHHTDAEREWAYDRDSHVGRLVRGLDEAEQRGWVVVDMARDWATIFP